MMGVVPPPRPIKELSTLCQKSWVLRIGIVLVETFRSPFTRLLSSYELQVRLKLGLPHFIALGYKISPYNTCNVLQVCTIGTRTILCCSFYEQTF